MDDDISITKQGPEHDKSETPLHHHDRKIGREFQRV